MDWMSRLTEGFLLGVALSPACLGVCVPLLVPYFGSEPRPFKKNVAAFGEFMAGRLLGYIGMGLLAGWMGQTWIKQLGPNSFLEGLTNLGFGIILIVFALMQSFPRWSLCSWFARRLPQSFTPFGLGLLTGINICPPFVAALLAAAQTGGWLAGALVLFAFFIGTSLILLPLPGFGLMAKEEVMQTAGRVAAGIVGIWFLGKGILVLIS